MVGCGIVKCISTRTFEGYEFSMVWYPNKIESDVSTLCWVSGIQS